MTALKMKAIAEALANPGKNVEYEEEMYYNGK